MYNKDVYKRQAYIREMAQMQELLQTEQAELDRTEAAILDATDQLYINSATWTPVSYTHLDVYKRQ